LLLHCSASDKTAADTEVTIYAACRGFVLPHLLVACLLQEPVTVGGAAAVVTARAPAAVGLAQASAVSSWCLKDYCAGVDQGVIRSCDKNTRNSCQMVVSHTIFKHAQPLQAALQVSREGFDN
jgi:hypothetical protein